MKKIIMTALLMLLLSFSFKDANAWVYYSGYAFIEWNGNPWTATSGTVYCSGPITVTCCAVAGNTIAINMAGHWWFGTLSAPYNDPGDGHSSGQFDYTGLTEGDQP